MGEPTSGGKISWVLVYWHSEPLGYGVTSTDCLPSYLVTRFVLISDITNSAEIEYRISFRNKLSYLLNCPVGRVYIHSAQEISVGEPDRFEIEGLTFSSPAAPCRMQESHCWELE